MKTRRDQLDRMVAKLRKRHLEEPPTSTYQKGFVWFLILLCLAGLAYKILAWLKLW
jgi:hypothetical protein